MNDRIVIDPGICHGKPVIRGTRTPVAIVLGSLAGGMSFEEIERQYGLTADDIRAALAFAGGLVEQDGHPRLARLAAEGILIRDEDEVCAYMESHPDLAELVPAVCSEARKEFGKEAELSLELYRDPEIHDRHLVLYVRLPAYDESILGRMDRVTQPFDEGLSSASGHLLVTTDLRRPREKHAV